MLWPLVLFVLAASIEAADVKGPKKILILKAAKSVADVKPGKSIVSSSREVNTESIDLNLINGTEADIDEFPFYAMLSRRAHVDETMKNGSPIKLLCGSSLVHPRFLISAWHCFKKDKDPKHVVAVFHITNRCKPDIKNIAWHELLKVHFHPGSITNRKVKRHDLVLIELQNEVNDVSPLLMPSQPPTVGIVGTIIGFGRTAWSKEKIDKQVPCTLRKTFETVEVWERCRHPGEKVIGAFCGVATTTTACRGDSGGPWLTWNNGAYELQGVVSFGSVQCDAKQANDHYTNVYAYKDWILTTIRNSLSAVNHARASSAILEPNELDDNSNFNAMDTDTPLADQKYTARAPIYPQVLSPRKNYTTLPTRPEPQNFHRSRSPISFGEPSRLNVDLSVQKHPSMQWPHTSQVQTSIQWPNSDHTGHLQRYQWPQRQQQVQQPWQHLSVSSQQFTQPWLPTQQNFAQQNFDMTQMFCHLLAIPSPACHPQLLPFNNYNHYHSQPFGPNVPQQELMTPGVGPSAISFGRNIASSASSATPPGDTKQTTISKSSPQRKK